RIPIAGSLLLLYAMAFLFLLSTLGLGIFISTVTHTQQQAMFVAWFTLIFTLLLSGFFVPIANMPRLVQRLTYLNPLRYFITILREIYLKAATFGNLWREAVSLGAMGLALITVSSLRFRRHLQ
ncbi:MAG: ABC transporter permease, partial [Spirochaetales bacterium]|nr:ABC transporter permease [Spirochaetales bacterium]